VCVRVCMSVRDREHMFWKVLHIVTFIRCIYKGADFSEFTFSRTAGLIRRQSVSEVCIRDLAIDLK
jgi:hypothetical protein